MTHLFSVISDQLSVTRKQRSDDRSRDPVNAQRSGRWSLITGHWFMVGGLGVDPDKPSL
jgi:hypothetical protein